MPRRGRLARRRKAVGLSQEQLADAVGVDRTTVNRWEAGKSEPQPWTRRSLAKALQVTLGDLDSLLVAEARAAHPDDDGHQAEAADGAAQLAAAVASESVGVASDPMRRRTVLAWGVTGAAAQLPGVSGLDEVGRVGSGDARRLQRAAVRLYSLDYRHGGQGLWQAAIAQASDGHRLLERGTYSGAVEGQLVRATGRLQMCAGWLAFDAGRHDVARSCYTDALALARQTGDAEVETHALANLAFQSNLLGMPREAMRFAVGAESASVAPGTPPRLAAIPQIRKAIAAAMTKERRDADRAVGAARHVLDRDSDKDAEEWCAFLSPAELDGIEGTCAIELGRATAAARLLERAVAGYGDRYARNRALFRVRLARARLDAKLVEGAAEAASGVLDDLTDDVGSWRVSNELGHVARRLAQYPSVPVVAEFLARHATTRQQ